METVKILYHYRDCPRIEKHGDWFDLRACGVKINGIPINYSELWSFRPGDELLIDLGVSIQLPKNYEAIVAPRSSTFKRYGLIMVNSIGVIDNSYCGPNDIWLSHMYCLASKNSIKRYDRIVQFRIVPNQPSLDLEEVTTLTSPDRGGFGSTGQ